MNQKGFVNTALIIVVVVFVGVAAKFYFDKKSLSSEEPVQAPKSDPFQRSRGSLDESSYIDIGTCNEKAKFVIEKINLKLVHSCDVESLKYDGGIGYYVQFLVGPPQDCPAGCIYKGVAKMVVQNKIYDFFSYGIHPIKTGGGDRIIGIQSLAKFISAHIQFVSSSESGMNWMLENALSPKKELVSTNGSFAIKYIFRNSIEGFTLLHSDGKVAGEISSKILTADEAQKIAQNKLQNKKGFEGYSARINVLDKDGSWLLDVAKYPRIGPTGSDLLCTMSVRSEEDLRVKCSNAQTISWDELPWIPWTAVSYEGFFK